MPKTTAKPLRLTIELPEGKPSEFRIWRAGVNPTRNGYDVLFDAQAAEQVMAAYAEHGVEMMIDLEHLSMEDVARSVNFDPDARGWCKLEVRDGELWAVDVRWTPDGERRLSERTQRYVSPTFYLDEEGRPTRVVNIALVAMPATDGAVPLAARLTPATKGNDMDFKKARLVIRRAHRLSRAGLAPAAVIKRLSEDEDDLEKAADGEGQAGAVDTAELAKFFGITVDPAQDPARFIAELLSALDSASTQLRGQSAPSTPPDSETAAPGEEMAASREVLRLTGAKSLVGAISTLADWRKLAVEHEAEQKKLAAEREALRMTRYRQMATRLVKCGAELPATAWADPMTATQPAAHLLAQPLEQLEQRATAFEALNGTDPKKLGAKPDGAGALSERELRMCADMKIDPKQYAAQKAAMKNRKG